MLLTKMLKGSQFTRIELTQALNYTHLSEIHDLTFASGTGPLSLKRQAEVTLLSGRNIRYLVLYHFH
jgi:hypothetical protein